MVVKIDLIKNYKSSEVFLLKYRKSSVKDKREGGLGTVGGSTKRQRLRPEPKPEVLDITERDHRR